LRGSAVREELDAAMQDERIGGQDMGVHEKNGVQTQSWKK
jgi:hypothetical protein